MRTVSFSSAPVRELLNSRFENSFLSSLGDSSAGSSVGHAPTDSPGSCSRGIGRQNVQCLFMTPDGRVFHASSGFRSSDDLLTELQFALKTFEAIQKSPDEAPAIVTQVHKQRLLDGGFSEEQIRRPANSPFALMASLSDLGRPSQAGSQLTRWAVHDDPPVDPVCRIPQRPAATHRQRIFRVLQHEQRKCVRREDWKLTAHTVSIGERPIRRTVKVVLTAHDHATRKAEL
jgi:hypothetical protein